jgi:DNA ligase-1
VTLLAEVGDASARIAASASRLIKIRELAQCLRRLEAGEIEIAIPFLSGETRQGKLALGHATLSEARGEPAASASLSLRDVDSAFDALKGARGKGAAQRRSTLLKSLFEKATAQEQDFLFRLVVGELRQGALEGLMLEGVAAAAGLPPADVRRAATLAGGIAKVAHAALTEGRAGLARYSIEIMRPILPMLAQPAETVAAALSALGEAHLEWKLDGARVQVHKAGDEVKVFTRSLNEVTAAVPEVAAAARAARGRTLILDGEAIALRADGKPHPFQTTMRRFGRKADDRALREELPLSVFFFDCMLADDVALVDRPLAERRAALERSVQPENLTPTLVSSDAAQAEAFYAQAMSRGHEGIMAKALDSTYEAGRRGASWLKVKRAHTLDLVVLAAEWGSGRRRGWLSNLHLGARDPASGGFVMLGKTFKGLTDATLEWQTREFLARETGRDEWTVRLRPELVVEIAFNDLQQSPQYPGGLALRFARVKAYRPDKRAEEADTIDTVRRIFEAQGAG